MSEWQQIETRPEEGEFLAYDPISGKQDVCYAVTEDIYGFVDVTESGRPFTSNRGKVGSRNSCRAVQQDGEYGPDNDEFQGERATHWHELLSPPTQQPLRASGTGS